MDRRRILFFLVAAGLLVPIVLSAMRLADLKRNDAALDVVEERIESESFGSALGGLRKLSGEKQDADSPLSAKQRTRLNDLALRIVEGALAASHPIRKVGMKAFDAEDGGVLVFGSNAVTIDARLRPRELEGSVAALRIGETRVPFRNGAITHRVTLPDDEAPVVLTLAAIVDLPDGTEAEVPLAGSLRLRQDTSSPQVALHIGDTVVRPPAPGEATAAPAVVPPGEGVRVSIADPLGLERASFTLDTEPESRRYQGDKTADDFIFEADAFRSGGMRKLVIEVENSLGNKTTATFQLDTKGSNWLPLEEAWLDSKRLKDGTNVVRGTKLRLRLVLEPGVAAADVGIAVRVDGSREPRPLTVADGALVATIELDASASSSGISIVRGTRTLKTWVLRVDGAAPKVIVTAGGRTLPADGQTVLEPGAIVRVTARDSTGVSKLSVVTDGLVETGEEGRDRTSWYRDYELGKDVDGGLTVVAVDATGNATEAVKWRIRARRQIKIGKLTIAGHDVGLDTIAVTHHQAKVALTYEGEGTIAWTLTDPDATDPISTGSIDLDGSGDGFIDLDLQVGDDLDAARVVTMTDPISKRTLGVVRLRVDRIPPRVRVGDWDPIRDGPRDKFEAAPGTRLIIEVEEKGGDAKVQVTGSVILDRKVDGDVVRLTVGVPESLPANMVVHAQDAAGNRAGLAFQVVTPNAVPAVAIRLIHDGNTVQQAGPLLVKRPSELRAQIDNGRLVRATLGGTVLPIGKDGALGDPAVLPGAGPLELTVRDRAGAERPVRFLVSLVRYEVPAHFRSRLDAAAQSLKQGDPLKARTEAAALEKSVRAQAAEHLDPGESRLFLDRIRRLREEAGGGAADRAPPTLTNRRDGAVLVRVSPAAGGARFLPMYLYKSEVTVAMYRRFLTAVGDDPAWWAALPDPADVRRPLRGAERVRQTARALIPSDARPGAPIAGMTPAIAQAYVRWAGKGLRNGRLAVPTPNQWRLAAGRAVHPGATFPTTGAHPDGSDLEPARAIGEGGGAAFGYSGREFPQVSGSYAPGAFGLQDMAGNLWEIVRNPENEWFVLGGSCASGKQECRLDHLEKPNHDNRRLTGLRPVWIPKP